MDSDLKRFEEELKRLSPERLPDGLIARMEAAMESWEARPDPGESGEGGGKVVPFPSAEVGRLPRQTGSNLWAAAAGVALLGGLAALVLTGGSPGEKGGAITARATGPAVVVQPAEFAPQTARRKILGASNERLLVGEGAQPLGVTRLDYVDRMVFRNAQGEELHVEVPAVSYRVVPLVTD